MSNNHNDLTAAQESALAADRERRKAIMGCDDATGNQSLAAHLADDTNMTVEQALKVLAAAGVDATRNLVSRLGLKGFAKKV
jgi:hypothetical protein